MKNTTKFVILPLLTGVLLACNAMLPPFAATTSPGSSTTVPGAPPAGTSGPAGQPLANWEGIPIMPGAVSAENDAKGYTYSIKASLDDVKNFYVQQLGSQGWQPLGSGQASANSLIMIFSNGSDTVTVSVIPQSEGALYVFLTK